MNESKEDIDAQREDCEIEAQKEAMAREEALDDYYTDEEMGDNIAELMCDLD